MKKFILLLFLGVSIVLFSAFLKIEPGEKAYYDIYEERMDAFKSTAVELNQLIISIDEKDSTSITTIKSAIEAARTKMKAADFWFRYLDPVAQKSINGPLPVEWETEVFEKFEKPYKRIGNGLTIAAQYLEEEGWETKKLSELIEPAIKALKIYESDSITAFLKEYHHFYLCNRLFLLNLATIYTTGFECPDADAIIPELKKMVVANKEIYMAFNKSFPEKILSSEYMSLFTRMISFVNQQPDNFTQFDQYHFTRDYVNPLFAINQQLIKTYHVGSRSFVDYSLNELATSIFSKELYRGQNARGIFSRVEDAAAISRIDSIGKLFFYDPILSGNNQRSCASCHKPTEYFSDTTVSTALQFNGFDKLSRNTPSLINTEYNQLVMLDGKHISLQNQAKDVISNPIEMACDEKALIKKIMSCRSYKKALKQLLSYTPEREEISMDHIVSAITTYYSKYDHAYSLFDDAMNKKTELQPDVVKGFNLFMSKAQCATCHFAPQFNGVKPPYAGSEFEVLGVPADTSFKFISRDSGRFSVNAADETLRAFRTGTLRNITHTAPYMHNGVFGTLEEVIEFYNAGGGAGRGLNIPNQTLSSDKLNLTEIEKKQLIVFLQSLDEKIMMEPAPTSLPSSYIKALNKRKPGGIY